MGFAERIRQGSFAKRFALSLHQFSRINRRMHNKLFVADNTVALAGGRNMGNEYFGLGQQSNFIDMDVLATGAVVPELSSVFDGYWNSPLAYPIHSLAATQLPAAAAAARFDTLTQGAAETLPVALRDRSGRTTVDQQLQVGRLDQIFASVLVAADNPAKAAGQADEARTSRAVVSAAMAQSRDELLIMTPYFIPGEGGMSMMQSVLEQQARLVVMTNSLGATDEPLVHAGYAKYRTAMLKMGVVLHEVSAVLSRDTSLIGSLHSSAGRLHAKVAVIDRRVLVIGSMNVDGRSAHYNTELSLLIDSPALAAEMATLFDADLQASAYQLRLAADQQRIEWLSTEQGQQVLHRAEPGSKGGLAQSLKMTLLTALVDEDLL